MLDKIIESNRYVVDNSKLVKINEEEIGNFIKSFKTVKHKHWLSNSPYNLLELPVELIINFLLIYESIDFSFWGNPKWKVKTENGEEDGSVALLYTILKYVKHKKVADFSKVTKDEFREILKGNTEIPLFEERYNIVKNISKTVNEKMNGNFYEFIKDVNTDKELFKIIVENFPDFKDERTYKGKVIYFYKLAQLLTSDILHIRELKENITIDYSHLVGCADYKIPQVMRALKILEYSKDLEEIIDNKKEIEVNSEYEVEIRAAMIVVIDIIKKKLENKICAMDINDYIWGQARIKGINLKPYHLTRNINY